MLIREYYGNPVKHYFNRPSDKNTSVLAILKNRFQLYYAGDTTTILFFSRMSRNHT